MPFPAHTKNGCCPWECVSALQKYVRRGLEREALEAAAELSETHLAFMLNRLRVIAHEDVGLANPQAPLLAKAWTEQTWDWHKARNGAWRLSLANTILLLCRSPKSREADHFQCAAFAKFDAGQPIDIPDFALCKHTHRSKKLGRGVQHFREVGAVLHPDPGPDRYEDEAYQVWLAQEKSGSPSSSTTQAGNVSSSAPPSLSKGAQGGSPQKSLPLHSPRASPP